MAKKRLIYKTKHGDIPVIIRDYVPRGEVWFLNGDYPEELFEKEMTTVNINTQKVKKVNFISRFKKRRFGKITNLLD